MIEINQRRKMLTPEEKQKARDARLEKKRLEDLELERQLQEIRDRKRSRKMDDGRVLQSATTPPRDSSLRGKLTYNAWGYGQHTGQVFRGHCGR